ncbi:DUF2499 domain-containing protein [Pycnococcus provasolii]
MRLHMRLPQLPTPKTARTGHRCGYVTKRRVAPPRSRRYDQQRWPRRMYDSQMWRANVFPLDVSDALGITNAQYEQVEGALFGASLFPYLVFLGFLGREETRAPVDVNYGFQFLLIFVFGTIPCGIYCKTQLDDILANLDWLHGSAESLLTVTNLIILIGARRALAERVRLPDPKAYTSTSGDADSEDATLDNRPADVLRTAVVTVVGMAALSYAAETTTNAMAAAHHTSATFDGDISFDELVGTWRELAVYVSSYVEPHTEPANALSLATWSIHVSSLVEWLASMELLWYWADISGNPRWKGLTWGMVPCHASGLAACTFHLFYNDPRLSAIVAAQAALTVIGNATCGLAAYRIWAYAKDADDALTPAQLSPKQLARLREKTVVYPEPVFLFQLTFVTILTSASIKYGSLYADVLFADGTGGEGSASSHLALAFMCVMLPTALNVQKWKLRSEL